MNQPIDPANFPAAAISDPNIDSETLALLAQHRPDLWQGILAHPNCYPGLAGWIQQQLPQAPSQGSPSEPAWGAAQGPTSESSQSASSPWQGAAPSSGQQFADGARQMASGAAQTLQGAVGAQKQATGAAKFLGWVPAVLAGFSVLAIIATFFPALSADLGGWGHRSFSFYGAAAGHEGVYLLILFLLTAAAAVLVFLKSQLLWARIVAGVLGLVAGIFGLVDGFGTTGNASGYAVVSVGAGAVMLGIFSIFVVLAALAVFVPPEKVDQAAAQNRAGQPQQWGAAPGQRMPQDPQE